MSYLEINNLCKNYGSNETLVKALDNVSFKVEEGEIVVILGASGAGKSTLLNILGGMDRATSGSYIVDGKEISQYNDKSLGDFRRYDIGFVFQFYNLMPNLTALENIQLGESVAINPMNSRDALAAVGLEKRANNFPSQLSGGEQQRISIARALVKNPKILLCDEPTGALDSKTGKFVMSTLLDLAKENHRTVIIVTHNANLRALANRVIRMSDGSVIENIVQNPGKVDDIEWYKQILYCERRIFAKLKKIGNNF